MAQRLWIRWRAGTASRRLLASIGCGFLFVGLYLVAVRTAAGQDMDDRAFELVYSLAPPGTVALMTWFARGFVIVVLAALVLFLTLAAAHRHAWRSVAVALMIVGLTVLTTTFLRPADTPERPRGDIPGEQPALDARLGRVRARRRSRGPVAAATALVARQRGVSSRPTRRTGQRAGPGAPR